MLFLSWPVPCLYIVSSLSVHLVVSTGPTAARGSPVLFLFSPSSCPEGISVSWDKGSGGGTMQSFFFPSLFSLTALLRRQPKSQAGLSLGPEESGKEAGKWGGDAREKRVLLWNVYISNSGITGSTFGLVLWFYFAFPWWLICISLIFHIFYIWKVPIFLLSCPFHWFVEVFYIINIWTANIFSSSMGTFSLP